MPVLLKNAKISTTRGDFSQATGVTSSAKTNLILDGEDIHIGAIPTNSYKLLPASVIETSDFECKLEAGRDIRKQDIVAAITLMDGVTPWPGLSVNPAGSGTKTYWVTYVYEGTPGPLASRYAYIGEFTGGGPTDR